MTGPKELIDKLHKNHLKIHCPQDSGCLREIGDKEETTKII